jgi:hypothetical protein
MPRALATAALVHINTLLLQAVLEVPEFHDSVGDDERSALTPLFWSHINPYGRFRLNRYRWRGIGPVTDRLSRGSARGTSMSDERSSA